MKDYYTTETGLHLLKSFAQTEDGRGHNEKQYNRNKRGGVASPLQSAGDCRGLRLA